VRTRPGDRWFDAGLIGLLALAGAALGAAALSTFGAAVGGGVGSAAAIGIAHLRNRRWSRREAAIALPFPDTWRRFLEDRYEHYHRLPPDLRRRFEDDVRIFLAEKRITGVGIEATEDLKLLVAASAVTLSLGWPDYEWDRLTEVLLYPDDFDRDYNLEPGEQLGETHAWGTVILSVPALHESFEDPWDAYHVGLHEFAHLLDLGQGEFEGIPAGIDAAAAAEWVAVVEKERERMRRGKSVIDDYGEDDPVEFLGVAVEAFFEVSLALRLRHREVYRILSAYFRQDPAAWDDARGLRL
jgi:Mlc titration factor MtfA (ptsG expression regulator)